MQITLLNRKYNPNEKSIEKLFCFISNGLKAKGIELRAIENPYGSGFHNLIKAIFFFRKATHSNEIIHITGQIHFAAIALKSKKVIITVHDLGLYRALSVLRLCIFKFFWIYLPFRKAKFIVAISEKTKDEIIRIMPSVAHKIKVIPNCITLEIEPNVFLKNNVIPHILIIGTRSNKNIEKAITALKGLTVQLTIVGILSEIQKRLLEENNILYKNPINVGEKDLISIYQESDILLFPSVYEGFGLPILEAQAQNVLVVTSNISPLKEVAGKAAILVEPDTPESIRQGVVRMMEMPSEEKIKMIEEGKQNVKKYSISQSVKSYIQLYKECKQGVNNKNFKEEK